MPGRTLPPNPSLVQLKIQANGFAVLMPRASGPSRLGSPLTILGGKASHWSRCSKRH